MTSLIPFHDTEIIAQQIDGIPYVALKPVCESLGIDADSQAKRLKSQATQAPAVGSHGHNDRNWCRRQALRHDDDRPAHLHHVACHHPDQPHQGRRHPRASEHQANALLFQARAQMELCQAAKGLIHPDHLEARALAILDRATGEHTEPTNPILYTQDFLKSKNLSERRRKSVQGVFGKRLKRAYIERHGREPGRVGSRRRRTFPGTLTRRRARRCSQIRSISAMTEVSDVSHASTIRARALMSGCRWPFS